MAYDVLDVCRYVINYSNEKRYGMSNLKLQKILYFIQAYFLTCTDEGEKCFSDKIEAWDFGPVVPRAYHEYKMYGGGNIPRIDSYLAFDEKNIWKTKRIAFDENCISKKDRKYIEEVLDKFANYSATDLVTITHNQDPWRDAYEPNMNNEITVDAIRKYFNDYE